MRATNRAFFKRGGAACAAAAVLIGGTFAAGTATAAPSADSAPTSIATAVASATATSPATETALPDGLAEAVKQDLGKTVEEFNADAELVARAADVQAKVTVTTEQATPLAATQEAASVDSLFAAYTAQFGIKNLQAVMVNGNGEYVIRTGAAATASSTPLARSFTAAAQISVDDFASKYSNVVVESADGPAKAFGTDLTNGQGYIALNSTTGQGEICSTGWNGFSKTGTPAVISAGHCALDGLLDIAIQTNPIFDEAATGVPGVQPLARLGTFAFSQFGGPNNSRASDTGAATPGNIGTDVSAIDVSEPDLGQPAKVTDWTTPADPASSGPVVTGISDAIVGAPICKSGRTTGWSCGTVASKAIFLVGGKNYPGDPADVRAVRGFSSTDLKAGHGDSGGPIISGTTAVGMISAGDDSGTVYGVDLKDAMAHTDGYTVKIFLAAPKVTTTAPVYRKGTVTGTVAGAPAGTTVSVTIDGVTTEVTVGTDDSWSVAAPDKIGRFDITAQTKNGFSTSDITAASLTVLQALPAPAFTTPALNGAAATPVTAITGTGNAGTTVELDGDVTGTVVVAADGTWSVPATPALAPGIHTVRAKQTLAGWDDSPTTTTRFTVVPAAPAVVSPTQGQEFAFSQAPTVISGTNADGATVSVTINGKVYVAAVVDGTWSVTLAATPATGDYTISAVQVVGGIASSTGTSAFKVLAEPKPAPTAAAPTKALAAIPAAAAVGNNLTNTGASGSLLLLGGAGGLLLLGGAAFLPLHRPSAK